MESLLGIVFIGFIVWLIGPVAYWTLGICFVALLALGFYLGVRQKPDYWRGVPEKNRPQKKQAAKQENDNHQAQHNVRAEPSLGSRLFKAGMASSGKQQKAWQAASDFTVLQKNMQQQNNSHGAGW